MVQGWISGVLVAVAIKNLGLDEFKDILKENLTPVPAPVDETP